MRKNALIAFLTFIAFGCANNAKTSESSKTISSAYATNLENGRLETGWYYISETPTEFKRLLEKSDESFYIEPKPIAIKSEFGDMRIYESNAGGKHYVGLTIALKGNAQERWYEATSASIGKRLGLIIDNKLVNAAIVRAGIPNGMTALNRENYSKKELEKIKVTLTSK